MLKLLVMKINLINEVGAKPYFLAPLVRATEQAFSKTILGKTEVNLILIDKAGIKKINQQFRSKNKVTDVISYSLLDGNKMDYQSEVVLAGEVLITYEIAEQQAKKLGIKVSERLLQLMIHGLLHIIGFDHEKSIKAKEKMEKEEDRYFTKIYSKLC